MKLKEMTNQELVNALVQRAFNVANYPNNKSKSMELDRAVKEVMGRIGCAVEEKGNEKEDRGEQTAQA